jgi:hypothetical protein
MTKMQTAVNQISANQLKEGGAITAFQSNIIFDGNGLLIHHSASQGELYMQSNPDYTYMAH